MSIRATKSAIIAAAALAVTSSAALAQTFHIGLGIRETGVDTVPIGGNGGVTGPTGTGIEFIGYRPEPAASLIQGKPLVADGTWQTVTFTFGTDGVYGFAGSTANGTLNGTRGAFEHLGFQNTAGNTDKIAFFIDDIYNVVGGVPILIEDFESYAAVTTPSNGAPEVVFRDPRFSGSNAGVLTTQDTANVTAESAASGANSYRLGFQFNTSDPSKWLRFTTNNTANKPNPAIDFSPGNQLTFQLRAVVIPELTGWNLDADGSYNDAANWIGAVVPNTQNAIARFGTGATMTGPRTVTINETPTVNALLFKSAQPFTLAAADGHGLLMRGPLGFDNTITVEQGSHTITAGIEVGLRLALNVSHAADQLTISGPIYTTDMTTMPPVKVIDVIKSGPGKAIVTKLDFDQLTVSGGTLQFIAGTGTSKVNGLSIAGTSAAPTAKLDLNGNALVVDFGESATPVTTPPTDTVTSSLSAQRNRIIAGYNGGTWDGNGIVSTGLTSNKAIGYINAADAGFGTPEKPQFAGVNVDDTAVLIMVTFKGDTNLSGNVDFVDLLALAQNYNAAFVPTPTEFKTWANGDSNYDGIVDFRDLLALAQNYGASAVDLDAFSADFAADWALARSMVPEPTTLGVLGGLAVAGLRRRR